MVGCTRSSLNVMASEKGVVVGKIQFRDDGDLIDCSLMGVSGKNIPSFMDRVSDIR
jgi:meiotic recombination protein SPO11